MEQDSVQSKSLCDLPPELIGEMVIRMSVTDIGSLAGTCSYIRDATYTNVVWIRRCKKDFGIIIDPLVAEEAGRGSVWAFYSLLLHPFGSFLGPLREVRDVTIGESQYRFSAISSVSDPDESLIRYGSMFQLVHDGSLGLAC